MDPRPRSSLHPLRDAARAIPSWTRNGGALTIGFLGGSALLIFSLFAIPALLDIEERGVFGDAVAFDSTEWKRNAGDPFVIPIRSRMAGDLVRRRLLIGKTTREVEELLGPPNRRALSRERRRDVVAETRSESLRASPKSMLFAR